LSESIDIDEKRLDDLQKILLQLSKLSISSGNMDDILDINHETFLDLLEKEEGINKKEKLYLAFSLGKLLQTFATEMGEKIFHLEEDHDERIKSIGKKFACEVTKSLTLSKIDNLKLNLREKLKANFWAGFYNSKFYG
jgi:DNA-binding XRE family transcriptional regulator